MPLIKSGTKEAIGTNIREMQNAEHPHAQAVAAALSTARRYGKKYAAGGKVDRSHDIPYIAGISKNNRCLYVDRRLPKTLTVKGKTFDPAKYLRVHETHEHMLMTKQGMSYEKAHQSATEKEKAAVKTDGIDWNGYQAEMRGFAKETEHERHARKPKDLYLGPYKKASGGAVKGYADGSMVSDEDLSRADIERQAAPREGGLMQTIPQAVNVLSEPGGAGKIASAAGQWWKGQQPGEEVNNADIAGNIAKNPLVKPFVDIAKGPHDAMTGQMDREQMADWAAGTGMALIGAGSVRAKTGEVGVAGSKLKQPDTFHPQKNDYGEPVRIENPTTPTMPKSWDDPGTTATFVPGQQKLPEHINDIPFAPWQPPETWKGVQGVNPKVETPFTSHPNKGTASGVVIVEPDGRVWLNQPSNAFGGYEQSFPKGKQEHGLSLQENAIKEAFEETGLKVDIVGLLGDFEKDTSKTRYYLGRRTGGTPADMGWETQGMHLATLGDAAKLLNKEADQGVLRALTTPSKAAPANSLYDIHPDEVKQFKQESGPLGSNPGGLYRDPEGQQWYIKTPQTRDHAMNEKLASELYKLAGVPTAEVNLTELKGKPAVASKIIEGRQLNEYDPVMYPDLKGLREHFPADAWLANYDSIGLEKDNIIVDPTNKAHRIDMGGALRYRAQGKPKTDWGPNVKELESMRDPNINPNGAEVFGGELPGKETAARVAQIPKETIRDLVGKYGPNSNAAKTKLYDDLIHRRDQIAKEYGIGEEPSGGAPPAPDDWHLSSDEISAVGAIKPEPKSELPQTAAIKQAKETAKYIVDNYNGAKAIAKELHNIAEENGPNVAEAIFRELPEQFKAPVNQHIRQLTAEKATTPSEGFGSTADELEYLINQQKHEIQPEHHWNDSYESSGRKTVRENFDRFVKKLKWEDYKPPVQHDMTPFEFKHTTPEHLKKLGFNPQAKLYMGISLHEGMPLWDPKEVKAAAGERASFVADNPHVAGQYGPPEPFVARATSAMEVDWADLVGGEYYNGAAMDEAIEMARKRGADLLVIHGIRDLPDNMRQTQYAFLDPSVLRHVDAKFDKSKLHLRLPHAGLVGGGLFGYGMLKGQQENDVEPKKKAGGGGVSKDHWIMHQASRNLQREGTIKSPIPGRTDKIPMSVKAGSYIIPADVPSALGQGNSVAGGHILTSMFNSGPYGMNTMRGHGGARQPRLNMRPQSAKIPNYGMAEGGEAKGEEHVKIIAAGYEHVIPPEIVRDIGHGSIKAGHSVLDKFVLKVRKEHIATLKKLAPPKK